MWVKLLGIGAFRQFRLTTIFLLNLSHFLSCDDRLFTPGIWTLHLRFRSQACGGGVRGRSLDKTHRFGHPSRKYVSGMAHLIEWIPGKQIDRPTSWNLYANRTGNLSGWRRALSNLNPPSRLRRADCANSSKNCI